MLLNTRNVEMRLPTAPFGNGRKILFATRSSIGPGGVLDPRRP